MRVQNLRPELWQDKGSGSVTRHLTGSTILAMYGGSGSQARAGTE